MTANEDIPEIPTDQNNKQEESDEDIPEIDLNDLSIPDMEDDDKVKTTTFPFLLFTLYRML